MSISFLSWASGIPAISVARVPWAPMPAVPIVGAPEP
jgi:hypothetical protein